MEISQLREHLASRKALTTQLVARIQNLEAQLAQDSHNSSKPSSSDGYKRPPKQRSLRKATGKKPGGQTGHSGQALCQVAEKELDRILTYWYAPVKPVQSHL